MNTEIIALCLNLLDDMLFSSIPALGFAMMFQVPKRALPYCAMLSAFGHGLRTLLTHYYMPLTLATFFASLLIGSLGIYFSKRFLVHPKVMTVAAIVPMIPGVYAYKAMIALAQINLYGFSQMKFQMVVTNFIQTSFILGALAFGLSLPGMLFYRSKPIV